MAHPRILNSYSCKQQSEDSAEEILTSEIEVETLNKDEVNYIKITTADNCPDSNIMERATPKTVAEVDATDKWSLETQEAWTAVCQNSSLSLQLVEKKSECDSSEGRFKLKREVPQMEPLSNLFFNAQSEIASFSQIRQANFVTSNVRDSMPTFYCSQITKNIKHTLKRIPPLVPASSLQKFQMMSREPEIEGFEETSEKQEAELLFDSTNDHDSDMIIALPFETDGANMFENPFCTFQPNDSHQNIKLTLNSNKKSIIRDKIETTNGKSGTVRRSDDPQFSKKIKLEYFAESTSTDRESFDTLHWSETSHSEPIWNKNVKSVNPKPQTSHANLRCRKGSNSTDNSNAGNSKSRNTKKKKLEERNHPIAMRANRLRNSKINSNVAKRSNEKSTLAKVHSRLVKTLSGLKKRTKSKFEFQCIICKAGFDDKYEFHRHLTLAHPGVRVTFCELCSSSFHTKEELEEHRLSYHKITAKNFGSKFMVIDSAVEMKPKVPNSDKVIPKKSKKRQNLTSNSRVSINNFRAHLRKQKIAGSSLNTKSSKKKIQRMSIKNRKLRVRKESQISRNQYVEADVLRYGDAKMKNNFKNAQVRTLTVSLTRLENSEFQKYWKKLDKSSLKNSQSKSSERGVSLAGNKSAVSSKKRQIEESLKTSGSTKKSLNSRNKRSIRTNISEKKDFTISHDSEDSKLNSSSDASRSRINTRSQKNKLFSTECPDIAENKNEKISVSNDEINVENLSDSSENLTSKSSLISKNSKSNSNEEPSSKDDEETITDKSRYFLRISLIPKDLETQESQKIKDLDSRKSKSEYSEEMSTEQENEETNILKNYIEANQTIDKTNPDDLNQNEMVTDLEEKSKENSNNPVEEKSKTVDNENQESKEKSPEGDESKSTGIGRKLTKEDDDEDKDPDKRINYDNKKPEEKIDNDDVQEDEKTEEEEEVSLQLINDDDFCHSEFVDTETLETDCDLQENECDPMIEDTEDSSDETFDGTETLRYIQKKYTKKLNKNAEPGMPINVDTGNKRADNNYSGNTKSTEQKISLGEKIKSEPCHNCLKVFEFMKVMSEKMKNEKCSKSPLKCTLCERYFISLFHLKLHVVTNHLPCQNQISCEDNQQLILEESLKNSKTAIEMTVGCSQCMIKFSTLKELNNHIIAHHTALCWAEKSPNEIPNYLNDFRVSFLQTNSKNIVKNQKLYVPEKCENKLDNFSGMEKTGSSLRSTLDCPRCDSKFSTIKSYVQHLKKFHSSQSTLARRKDSQRPPSEWKSSLFRDESQEDILDSNFSADREYVLHQLLSDPEEEKALRNSSTLTLNHRSPETISRVSAESIVEKSPQDFTVVGYISSLHTCQVCRKKFKRAQDLLIHGLRHVDGDVSIAKAPSSESTSETKRQESSIDENGKENPDIDQRIGNEMDLEQNEDENVAVVYGTNGTSEKVILELMENSQGNKFEGKKRDESVTRESKEIDERSLSSKNTMAEFMETEKGLSIDKKNEMPIACEKCNRHFINRSSLNEHLFFLHDDSLKETVLVDVLGPDGSEGSEEPPKNWHCKECLQSFKLFQGYSRHRYYVHGDDSMVHVCENCSKVLTSVTMVNVHICTDVVTYNCRRCIESFPTGMSLRLHNSEKHVENRGPHTCEICNRNFLTHAMLERHVLRKHRFAKQGKQAKKSSLQKTCMEMKSNGEAEQSDIHFRGFKNGNSSNALKSPDVSEDRRRIPLKSRDVTKLEDVPLFSPVEKRKRGRPRKNCAPLAAPDSKPELEMNLNSFEEEKNKVECTNPSTLYVDETEIHQCSVCQLYCLSKSTLRNHVTQIHSMNDEICQLCQIMYPTGKLLRHMIENHVTPDEDSKIDSATSWKIGSNCNEMDTRIMARMLGSDRLVSLCEYRRYAEKIDETYPCPYCDKEFPSNELYRYHFLLNHDVICALCNIEFKKGQDAARHKGEIHGSVGRYIWFADRTVMALTSSKNFTDVTVELFVERLIKDEMMDVDFEAEENSNCNHSYGKREVSDRPCTLSGEATCDKKSEKNLFIISKDKIDSRQLDKKISAVQKNKMMNFDSDDSKEAEDVSVVIVVTDDDLEKFNIATRHPNLWGLAAKISSTDDEITPSQVKEILAWHFEREEDF